MGSTYYSLHYHWVCSTKERRRIIRAEWQEGYSIFAVSASRAEAGRESIAAQEAHHRQQTFEQELRELLERHGVQYDPRYLL